MDNRNNKRKKLSVKNTYQFTEEEQVGTCPTCGVEVLSSYNEMLCGKCGQRLGWELDN